MILYCSRIISSWRAASTDFHDPLPPLISIVHCSPYVLYMPHPVSVQQISTTALYLYSYRPMTFVPMITDGTIYSRIRTSF